MATHQFTLRDGQDLEDAIQCLKAISNRIESDTAALTKVDDYIYALLDFQDEIKQAIADNSQFGVGA